MSLLHAIVILCSLKSVLLLQFDNKKDTMEFDDLKQNLSMIQTIAENAVNEVHQLQQELSQETALRVSLQQELDRFKRQNFSAVLSQLTTVTDVLSEVHLLRQLLNQETSFRMTLENELKQQNQLTNALSTNITSLLRQLQILAYDSTRNNSDLQREIQQDRLLYQNEFSTTNHNMALLQNNITSELQTIHQNQGNLLSELQAVNMTLYQSIVDQSAINKFHTKEVMEMGHNITSLLHLVNNMNSSLSQEVTDMWHNMSEIRHKQDDSSSTAFSVRLSKPISNFPQDKIIKFDHIIYDDGKHYNPMTGVFTAPSAGVYSFYWSTLTVNGHFMSSILKVNGVPTLGALSDGRGGASYDSGSNMAVLRLELGDRIWVEHEDGGYIQSDFSSFSGFKIA